MTFNEIWPEYIEEKKRRVKPSSVGTYCCEWKRLRPVFGGMEIGDITTKKVEKWAVPACEHLNQKTVKYLILLLNNIIDYYEYEYEVKVSHISCKHIRWPSQHIVKGEIEQVRTFGASDLAAILQYITADPQPVNVVIAVMAGTGVRIGEACALRYENINTDNGTIEITGTVTRLPLAGIEMTDEDFERTGVKILHRAENSVLVLSSPKCLASRRAVPLPHELLHMLKMLKKIYPPEYYIGTNKFTPTEPRTLRNHYYRALKEAGVNKHLTPHSLRHTYATQLITSGIDVKTTAALLGHGDTSTTLLVYSHATTESKQKAMSKTVGKNFKKAFGKCNK